MSNSYEKVIVSKRYARRIRRGYLWIFRNELVKTGKCQPGDLVSVFDEGDRFLGIGSINLNSKIAVRIISRQKEIIDTDFFCRRFLNCLQLRQRLGYSPDGSFRLVFSEGDLLPGLVVDKFGAVLSMQISTAGMAQLKPLIVAALEEVIRPYSIIEKSDSSAGVQEGLSSQVGLVSGSPLPSPFVVNVNGLRFDIDIEGGQKTGFYLDQESNRRFAARFAPDAEACDAFCYTGGFAIHFALAGATSVAAVDGSAEAIRTLQHNCSLNGIEGIVQPQVADVSDFFAVLTREQRRFDIINLDPPAFAPAHKHLTAAAGAYRRLNAEAISLLKPGGILCTSSCSQAVSRDDFLKYLREAAGKARSSMRVIEIRGQSPDHPVLLSMPETDYLKFVVLQKL